MTSQTLCLLVHGERGGAHLVRRAHVDAIHFSMRRHRGEMNDAGREHDRKRRPPERAHQRAQSADAAGLSCRREVRKAKVGVGEIAGRRERQSIPGRPGDKIERRGAVRIVQQ